MLVNILIKKERKTLLNLLIYQEDTDKIFLYSKDRYKDKYQNLINKSQDIGKNI